MNNNPLGAPALITHEDIGWATRLLKLPPSAFYGDDGTDPRQEILISMETLDVAACPGSGKTTLLVAKLAILAEKWHSRTRGICALSHTNVARYEIEARLSNTMTGRRLLSYPHYVGTIHAFVNDFLAIPWLRRNEYPITLIDTGICERRRWRKLSFKTRSALEKRNLEQSDLRITDTEFNVGKKIGALPFGNHTETYAQLKKACEEVAREGYHCYDDMFLWAHNMIGKLPGIVDVIRDRFPLLFLDEAQDNSEDQSAILYRLFRANGCPVIRQRFGDSNQAIFDSMKNNEATTDKFSDITIKRDIPNSHRFGQKIAEFADPLGLIPYNLKGQGPKKALLASGTPEGQHTIFLVEPDSANKILNAYGELLLQTFSDKGLREGTYTAVGQIHRPPAVGSVQKFPQHIGDYWPDYDPELASRDPKPQTFVQYLVVGMGRAEAAGEAYLCVDKIAEGILRLASMAAGTKAIPHRKHPHRCVLKILQEFNAVRECYKDLVLSFAERRGVLTEKVWTVRWQTVVREVAEAIAGAPLTSPEADRFLEWWHDGTPPEETSPEVHKRRDNLYRYCRGGRRVDIRVGSIHSAKGETHTATLVMETFWYDHNIEALLPWLVGDRSGQLDTGVRQKLRLKVHYVAMTRPTHLICLAMKRSTLTRDNGDLNQNVTQKLVSRGWQIKSI